MQIDDVLAPMSVTTFVNDYLGQQYFRQSGSSRRFVELLSWAQLNEVMGQLRVSANRVSLMMNGRPVPERDYLCHPGRPVGSQLNSGSTMEKLRQGATLIVNGVDELVRPVQELAESFERIFHVHVGVNLYAGWRRQHGFDLHWDSHDTLILQVSGRKGWRVYKPTRMYPVIDDVETAPTPTEPPVWEGLLEDGDLLYMPRGWWHIATPIDEPSLHLTIGLIRRTGYDLLNWAVGRMKECPEVRMEVPSLASAEEQRVYIARLRDHAVEMLANTTIDDFMVWTEAGIAPRPHFLLPAVNAPLSLSLTGRTTLRLARLRRLWLQDVDAERLKIEIAGKAWSCGSALRPALELLSARDARQVNDLLAAVPPDSVNQLRIFLIELIAAGILQCEGEAPSSQNAREGGQMRTRDDLKAGVLDR